LLLLKTMYRMKKSIFQSGFLLALTAGFFGCKDIGNKRIDIAQVHQLEDSIPTFIPGVSTIHTIQDDDYTKVKVIIGDVQFYNMSPEMKQQAANRMGLALLRILGKDNNLSKATLIVTKNITDNIDNPPDGINTDANMDSLKKVVYPGK
jgi:hypothetical protein